MWECQCWTWLCICLTVCVCLCWREEVFQKEKEAKSCLHLFAGGQNPYQYWKITLSWNYLHHKVQNFTGVVQEVEDCCTLKAPNLWISRFSPDFHGFSWLLCETFRVGLPGALGEGPAGDAGVASFGRLSAITSWLRLGRPWFKKRFQGHHRAARAHRSNVILKSVWKEVKCYCSILFYP